MSRLKGEKGFALSLFAAASAWYLSLLLAFQLGKNHTIITQPNWLYKMYWMAFYDEYQQHLFYNAFIILSVLFGFVLKVIPNASAISSKILITGTVGAILSMPLAAIGVFGLSMAANWPSQAPPIMITAGGLLCLPGLLVLIFTLFNSRQ